MLSSHLTFVREAQEPVADLSRLAEQVVWLVVALAMYRHWSISEVLDSLDLELPDERAVRQQERRGAGAPACRRGAAGLAI
jgi:hypothetical protein